MQTIKIYFCYSHEDETLRYELEKHLSPLRRMRQITGWFDHNVQPGLEIKYEIENQIDAADVILLLVSPDFIASDYCYTFEMLRALDRHEKGKARVIPIILRPVYWKETPIGKLKALPKEERPVTEWANHDNAFLDVAKGIRDIINELLPKEALSKEETHTLAHLGEEIPFLASPYPINHKTSTRTRNSRMLYLYRERFISKNNLKEYKTYAIITPIAISIGLLSLAALLIFIMMAIFGHSQPFLAWLIDISLIFLCFILVFFP